MLDLGTLHQRQMERRSLLLLWWWLAVSINVLIFNLVFWKVWFSVNYTNFSQVPLVLSPKSVGESPGITRHWSYRKYLNFPFLFPQDLIHFHKLKEWLFIIFDYQLSMINQNPPQFIFITNKEKLNINILLGCMMNAPSFATKRGVMRNNSFHGLSSLLCHLFIPSGDKTELCSRVSGKNPSFLWNWMNIECESNKHSANSERIDWNKFKLTLEYCRINFSNHFPSAFISCWNSRKYGFIW